MDSSAQNQASRLCVVCLASLYLCSGRRWPSAAGFKIARNLHVGMFHFVVQWNGTEFIAILVGFIGVILTISKEYEGQARLARLRIAFDLYVKICDSFQDLLDHHLKPDQYYSKLNSIIVTANICSKMLNVDLDKIFLRTLQNEQMLNGHIDEMKVQFLKFKASIGFDQSRDDYISSTEEYIDLVNSIEKDLYEIVHSLGDNTLTAFKIDGQSIWRKKRSISN